ncbi:AraC family transcriptional regulator [Streptomyces sp. NPDC094032]|uniref:helix-turn-helix transcriptional regulator n=1 Tax=Streptomyces sp. NPDC094032 TaxID=3155308 RepID=UPI00333295C4
MDDLASTTLLDAVRRALAEDGIEVGGGAVYGPDSAADGSYGTSGTSGTPGAPGALVPFGAKRRFLAGIARTHGLLPLLRVGLVLPRIAHDPVVTALLGARTPVDLLERWGRCERFTHARHRVVVTGAGETGLSAEHRGPPGKPPEAAEDVLVLGVLTVLLTLTGVRGLTVEAGRAGASAVLFAQGAFSAPPAGCDTARWRFTWTGTAPPAPLGPDAGSDTVSRARRLLADDLVRRWTLDALAAALGTSPRSLQRRLRGVGGFQGVLGAVRTEAAAGLLLEGRHPVGLVGFACGYADQPHFTRDFRRRTAVTPAAYRAAFARPASHTTEENHP